MKKYFKPEIKVNHFETNDIVATSCTCPDGCFSFHSSNSSEYADKLGKYLYSNPNPNTLYFHYNSDAAVKSILSSYEYNNHNYFVGECEDHGEYYKASKKN